MNDTLLQERGAAGPALDASFRDPNGFVFRSRGIIHRQINNSYQADYQRLMESGLYERLVREGLLIEHEECADISPGPGGWKIIRPRQITYLSWPAEWCFSQLRDAALCTMRIQLLALEHGMVLKDASAYNIQFEGGAPVFIDTLSFEAYREGAPWNAYRQFCQHFLGPLALMALTDVRLGQLFRAYIDGPPLDLVSKLLPRRSWFRYGLLTHIHLHARTQARYADLAADGDSEAKPAHVRPISQLAFRGLMESLENAVKNLYWKRVDTEWGDYYAATNYADEALDHKGELIQKFLNGLPEKPVLINDLGANNGRFTRIAAQAAGVPALAQDIDPVAVEKNYRLARKRGERNLLPLVQDLTNPLGGLGWQLRERESFLERGAGNGHLVMALALIHHLAISNNLPLERIAAFFAALGRYLIIEFVPKSDSQVQRLLATREDIFPDYSLEGFEAAFGELFEVRRKEGVRHSERTLYLLEKR